MLSGHDMDTMILNHDDEEDGEENSTMIINSGTMVMNDTMIENNLGTMVINDTDTDDSTMKSKTIVFFGLDSSGILFLGLFPYV